jgi:hypothetical protein
LLRIAILALAVLVGMQGTWLVATELLRPAAFVAPLDPDIAAPSLADRAAAREAASLGFFRGDLWAVYALSFANLCWDEKAATEATEVALAVSERALMLAPHDGRVWLVLACLRSRSADQKAAIALRTSYYTAPNEAALIPIRLLVAVRSDALADVELRELVGWQLRTIATRKPDLKYAIKVAYRQASPMGRKFLETSLQELDPALLQ